MTTVREFRLPDLGEGLTSADLVSWTVKVGETVALNQTLAEVETAKALVELPSPYSGVMEALLVEPGATVPVGTPIVRISGQHDLESPSVLVGYGPRTDQGSRRRSRVSPTLTGRRATDSPPATPAARGAAREAGIDVSEVIGSGPDGAVTAADVADAVRPARTPSSSHVPELRKQMAAAMIASSHVPQAHVFVTVDVTSSMDMLTRLRASKAFTDLSVTPLTLAAKALVTAIASHPVVNSSWDEARGTVVTNEHVNLGIAVAAEHGLSVPNIKNADKMSLVDLARAVTDLTVDARAGRTDLRSLTGGTVTITNVGVFGVDGGIALLNPGEAAIVCLGAVSDRPWVVDERIEVRSVVTLSLTFDHRVLDGEQAARFLSFTASMLEDPAQMLAHL